MFHSIVDIPVNQLRILGLWDTPTENAILRGVHYLYRLLSQFILVTIPNILLIAYLTTVDDVGVSFSFSTGGFDAIFIYDNQYQVISYNVNITFLVIFWKLILLRFIFEYLVQNGFVESSPRSALSIHGQNGITFICTERNKRRSVSGRQWSKNIILKWLFRKLRSYMAAKKLARSLSMCISMGTYTSIIATTIPKLFTRTLPFLFW